MRFIDTNLFVYTITAHPSYGETTRRILERVEADECAATSVLVLCEVAWVLEVMGRQDNIEPTLEKVLSYKNLRLIEYDERGHPVGSEQHGRP